MRNFLKSGLESYGYGDLNISCEEADVLNDEAQADLAEASGDLETAERLADVSDAMEDMAAIVDGVDEPTETERNLVEVAGDMAVAGSDVEAEEIMVPATESFGRPGMESIGERARQIWDKVLAMLKKIWEKIEGFFYKIFGSVPSKRRNLKSLRDAVDKASSKSIDKDNKKFKVSSTKGLTVNNQGVKTAAAFQSAVNDSVAAVKWGTEDYSAKLKQAGEKLADAVGDFDADKVTEFAASVVKSLEILPKIPGAQSETGDRFGGMASVVGSALLGNRSIVLRHPKSGDVKGTAGSHLHTLEMARRTAIMFLATNHKKDEAASDFEFETLSTSQMEKLLDSAETILDQIEQFSRGQRAKDISAARKKIETASTKASTAWDKRMDDKDNKPTEEQRALFKAALGFNLSYANLAKEPIASLIQHGLSVTSTIFALVNKSVSLHK